MQILRKTISVLLAVQLLVSFGLYGGICCVTAAGLSAAQIVAQADKAEENLPPCHRKKAAESAAAKQDHQAHSKHHTSSAKHTPPAHQRSGNVLAASVLNRNCCTMKREVPDGEPLPSTIALSTGKLIAEFVVSPWSDGEIAVGLPSIPFQVSATYSPPHTGFQLSLRI